MNNQRPTRRSDQRRFDAMVNRHGPLQTHMHVPCWKWTGAADGRGYPKFWLDGNSTTAQRAVYLLAGVELTPDQRVMTLCSNRLCVRPDHLVVGNLHEAHGLRMRGDNNWLRPGERMCIREWVVGGEATVDEIVEFCDVRAELVERIVES